MKDRGYIGEIDQGHLVPGSLGMGLVEGYELMNLKLAEPKLRAGLEEDLKAICLGQKNPQDVLRQQIEKHKECYQIIARELQLLDQAIGQRFGAQPQAVAAAIDIAPIQGLFKCPKCRVGSMAIRQKKDNAGSYIGCLTYPECNNAVWFSSDVKTITALDEVCGACGGQNKKVKIKFSRISMLGLINETPAFSRIEDTHYITCLICDQTLRDLLTIRADTVKVLGNIVGAATRPIHQNNQQPNGRYPPARGFGTQANTDNNHAQRRGWGNDDDDDDNNRRPGGGGAIAVGNQNRGWNASNSGAPAAVRNPLPVNSRNPLPPSSVLCHCKKPTKYLTVGKDGPNKGRPFHNCNARQCNFFQWGDVPPPADNQNNQPITSSGATGRSVTRRKCSACRTEGHTKRNCPNMPRD